jgi:hypothetical protein
MKRWKLISRELKNYFYLRRTLAKESKTTNSEHPWVKYKLRKNWYGRIYTVVSLREEDMGEEEVVRNWKAMEMMRPINDYLTSLDLQEIVFPSIEKIPDSRSYLVVYSPMFSNLSFRWFFWRLMLAIFITSVSYIIYTKF